MLAKSIVENAKEREIALTVRGMTKTAKYVQAQISVPNAMGTENVLSAKELESLKGDVSGDTANSWPAAGDVTP